MAVRYRPLPGALDGDTQEQDEGVASPLSPTSTSRSRSTTSTGLASPLPSPTSSNYYQTLAEQTFTPLSMGSSDFSPSENTEDDGGVEGVLEKTGLLRASRVLKHSRPRVGGFLGKGSSTRNISVNPSSPSSTSTVPALAAGLAGPATTSPTPAGHGATIVSAMIQSFEALQATYATTGYELISTNNVKNPNGNGHRRRPDLGVVSPPSTVSPSLSPSPSPSLSASQSPSSSLSFSPGRKRGKREAPAASSASRSVPVGARAARQTDPFAAPDARENENRKLGPRVPIPIATESDNANPAKPTNPWSAPLNTSVTDFALPTNVGTVENAPVRPTPVSSPPCTPQLPSQAPIVRTSSTAGVTVSHPTPDLNKRSRSGANLGNIAALEATAERLSMTSSIEDAIREEHKELKLSDSRRSSILRANSASSARKTSSSDGGSVHGQARLAAISRQSSIVGLNNAARFGGYSPGGYFMSPQPSVSGVSARLRSGSKTGSIGVQSPIAGNDESTGVSTNIGGGEGFPFLSRHGAGNTSTRSTASKLSFVQAAGLDEPTALTREAFEEADRAAHAGEDPDDDDTIRASAYQHIEAQFADEDEEQTDVLQPMLDHSLPARRLQLHEPTSHPLYQEQPQVRADERPTTSGSGATYEQAQAAFGDFDGVHCQPEVDEFPPALEPALVRERPKPRGPPPARPKSYFDPSTGQEMLYYPAPVPAMLNLPPKLSKKPKAAARNVRRSQLVVNAMPQESRESRVWLPDPMEGLRGSQDNLPFMTEFLGDNLGSPGSAPSNTGQTPQVPGAEGGVDLAHLEPKHARNPSETSTIHPLTPLEQTTTASAAQRGIRRPQRLTAAVDKRKTRATLLDGLPPQLRASAFFDLPSEAPKIEIKGGSAMATLDSILDASAHAPVSAFTDHAFAGKLGSEVYGREKKKKKKAKKGAADKQSGDSRKTTTMSKSTSDLLEPPPQPKKRASALSLLGGRRRTSEDLDANDGRTTLGLVSGQDGDDSSPRVDQEAFPPGGLAPDTDEESEEDEDEDESEEEEEEEDMYQGAPTTLLAELQKRKQQNKLRTRPATHAYPNGMHSTLLELDAVAQVEQKARHGKRINLAWEDPNANPDHTDDLDDDDIPLGMLYVAKASGLSRSTMDISALMSEVHRPLGLMERREQEDNEPLSRRRERLQNGQGGSQLPVSLDVVRQRISQLHPSPYGSNGALGLRSQSRLGLPVLSPGPGSVAGSVNGADEEVEFEGETLAQRKARLAAENPLPRARPVSGLFSAELLSQFGGDPEDEPRSASAAEKGKGKATDASDMPEEEETLGQRRRRLQAEREAREREMGGSGGPGAPSPTFIPGSGSADADANRVSRRLSMADMLNAHPFQAARGAADPREAERLRREAEVARVQMDQEAKMAMLRAQMPTVLPTPSIGARNGGYMGGKFNDGLGGTALPSGMGMGLAYGVNAAVPGAVMPQQRMSTIVPTSPYGAGMGYGAAPGVAMGGAQYGGGVPMNMNMGMGMPVNMNMAPAAAAAAYNPYGLPMPVTGPGHVDMVERWRQGVMPS